MPATSPFTVPPSVRPTEQRDREKLSTASAKNSGLAGYRYTNHDRMNTAQPSATSLSSVAETGLDTHPALRRIKTESGALSMSTKQYFQRKERERIERDAVQIAEVKPVQHSTDLKTVSNHITLKEQQQTDRPDPADKKPANIFESFHVIDCRQTDESSRTVTAAAVQADPATTVDHLDDVGVILKPEHVHGGSYSLELPSTITATTAAAAITTSSSAVAVSQGHDARQHAERRRDRRRSARHEDSTKPQRTDEADVNRQRTGHDQDSRPSPLKMKLSLLSASSPALHQCQDSQEHIRLKLNVSSGKVEKLGDTAAASDGSSKMKLVLSKDKVSGKYQHGTSGSESGHHHHHHRHHRRHHHHRHSRPDETKPAKRAAADSTAPHVQDKKARSDNGRHQQQQQLTQTNSVAISSILSRTHIPSTYRLSAAIPPPPPPPPPPLPSEEPSAPPPPPLPLQ